MSASTTGESLELLMGRELSSLGAVWIPVRGEDVFWPAPGDSVIAWRERLVLASAPIRTAIERDLAELLKGSGGAADVFDGVHVVPCVVRGAGGIVDDAGLAVVLTSSLLEHGSLSMLCNAARLDETLVRGLAADGDLPSDDSMSHIAPLIRRLHTQVLAQVREREVQQSVDSQLADTYEELHLLNSLIDGLVVGGDPEAFLESACRELAVTGGYAWVTAHIDATDGPLALRSFVHGDQAPGRAALREILDAERGTAARAATLEGHGEVGIASIRSGDECLGHLVAGGRAGGPLSSIELTLLGSAAGHLSVFLRNASLYADLDSLFLGTLQAMVAAIDAKDPYTRGHSQRVAELSRDLAMAIGLPDEFVRTAHLSGLVHDIGKIGVPEAVLKKSGRLDDEEFAAIRQHPQIGYRILKDIPQIRDLLPGVLCHHESWNGGGYPAGLSGDEIPLLARIVAICDSFDAMSSNRTYRRAMPREEIFAEIRRCAGSQFDPDIVPVFLGMDFTGYDRLLSQGIEESRSALKLVEDRGEAA